MSICSFPYHTVMHRKGMPHLDRCYFIIFANPHAFTVSSVMGIYAILYRIMEYGTTLVCTLW